MGAHFTFFKAQIYAAIAYLDICIFTHVFVYFSQLSTSYQEIIFKPQFLSSIMNAVDILYIAVRSIIICKMWFHHATVLRHNTKQWHFIHKDTFFSKYSMSQKSISCTYMLIYKVNNTSIVYLNGMTRKYLLRMRIA